MGSSESNSYTTENSYHVNDDLPVHVEDMDFQPLESTQGLSSIANPLEDFVFTYGPPEESNNTRMETDEPKDPLLEDIEIDIYPMEPTNPDENIVLESDQPINDNEPCSPPSTSPSEKQNMDYCSLQEPIVDPGIVNLKNFHFKPVGMDSNIICKPVDINKLMTKSVSGSSNERTTTTDTSFLPKTPNVSTNGHSKKHVGSPPIGLPFDAVSTFQVLRKKLQKPSCINSLDHVNPLNITMNQITNFSYLAMDHRKNYMMSWIRRVCLTRAIQCCQAVINYNNKIIYKEVPKSIPTLPKNQKMSSSSSVLDETTRELDESSIVQEIQDLSLLYQGIGEEALRFWKHLKKVYMVYTKDIKNSYEYLIKKTVVDLNKKHRVYGDYGGCVQGVTPKKTTEKSNPEPPLLVPKLETCDPNFGEMGMGPRMSSDFFLDPEKNFNRAAICFEFTRMDLQIFSAATTSFFSDKGFLSMFPVLVNIRTDKRTPLYHQLEQLLSYFFIILRKGFRFGKTYSLMDSMGMGKTFQHILCFSFMSNAFGWLIPVQKLEQMDPFKKSVIDFEQSVYECEGGNQFYEWIYSGFYDVQDKEELQKVMEPFLFKRETYGSFKIANSVADRVKTLIKDYCEQNTTLLTTLATPSSGTTSSSSNSSSSFIVNEPDAVSKLDKLSRLCKLLFILQNSSRRVSRKLEARQDVIGFENYLSAKTRIETRYHILKEVSNIVLHRVSTNPTKPLDEIISDDLKQLEAQFGELLSHPQYWFFSPQSSTYASGITGQLKAAVQTVLNNMSTSQNLLTNPVPSSSSSSSSSSKKSSRSKKRNKQNDGTTDGDDYPDKDDSASSTGSALRDAGVDIQDVEAESTLKATEIKSRMGSDFLNHISTSSTNKLFSINQLEEENGRNIKSSDDIDEENTRDRTKNSSDGTRKDSSSEFGDLLSTLWSSLGSPMLPSQKEDSENKPNQKSTCGRTILADLIRERKMTLIGAMTEITSKGCRLHTLSTIYDISAVPESAIDKFIAVPPDITRLNPAQARDENVNNFVRSMMRFPTRILDYFFNNQSGVTHLPPIVFCTLGTVGEWIEESIKVMTNPKIAVLSLGSVKRYKNLYMPTSSSAFFNNIEQFSDQRNVDFCETIAQYNSFEPSCVIVHHDIIGKLIEKVEESVDEIIKTVRSLHVTDQQLTKFCEHVQQKSIVKLMYDVFKKFNNFVKSNSFLVEFVVMVDHCKDGKNHFENLFQELKEERFKVEGKKNITIFMRHLQWAVEGAELFVSTYGHVGYLLNILFNDAVRAELDVMVPKLQKMSSGIMRSITETKTSLRNNKSISLSERAVFDDGLENVLTFCKHHSQDLLDKITSLQAKISEKSFGQLPPMALYMMSSEYSSGFDESHKLRNHNNKLHKCFKNMPTQHRSFLSGTPINNELTDELLTFINLWRSQGPWVRDRELSLYDIHKPLDFPEWKPTSLVKYVLGLDKPTSVPWMLPKTENFLNRFTNSKARLNLAISENMVVLMQLNPMLPFLNTDSRISMTYGVGNKQEEETKERFHSEHRSDLKLPNFLEGIDNLSEFGLPQKLLLLSHLFSSETLGNVKSKNTSTTSTMSSLKNIPSFDFYLLFNCEQFLTLVVSMWYNHLPKTFYVRDFLTKSVEQRVSRTSIHPFRSKGTYFDCINDILFYQNCCASTYHASPQIEDKLGKSLSFLTDNSMQYDIDPTYIRRIMDKPWNSTAISQTLIYATNHSKNGENICRACGSVSVPFSEYKDTIDIKSVTGTQLLTNNWHYGTEGVIAHEFEQICSNEFSVASPGYKEKLVSGSKFMRRIMYNVLSNIMQKKGQKGDNLCKDLKKYFNRTGTLILGPIEQVFRQELEIKSSWGCMCYSSHKDDFDKSLSHLITLISSTLHPKEKTNNNDENQKEGIMDEEPEPSDPDFDTKLLLFSLKYISFRLQKNYGGCIRHNPLAIYSDNILSESCQDAVGNLQVMGLGFFGMDVKMSTFYRMVQHSTMLYIKFQRYLEGRKEFALTEFRDWFYTKSQEHAKLPYFKKIEDNLPFFKNIFPTFPTTTDNSTTNDTGNTTTISTIAKPTVVKKLPLTESVKLTRDSTGKVSFTLITPSGKGTVAPPTARTTPIDENKPSTLDSTKPPESTPQPPELSAPDFIPTDEEISLANKLVVVITKDYANNYALGASKEIPCIPMYKKVVLHPKFFWGKTVGRPRKFTTVFSPHEQKVYLHYHSKKKDDKMEELFRMIESNTEYSGIIENHESYADMFHFMLGSVTNCISASADYRCKIPRSYPKCLRNGTEMIKIDEQDSDIAEGGHYYDQLVDHDSHTNMFKKLASKIDKGQCSEKAMAGFSQSAYGDDMIGVFLSLNYYGKDSLNPRTGLFDIDKLPSKYLLLAWYIINKTNIPETKHLKPDGTPIRKYDFDTSSVSVLSKSSPGSSSSTSKSSNKKLNTKGKKGKNKSKSDNDENENDDQDCNSGDTDNEQEQTEAQRTEFSANLKKMFEHNSQDENEESSEERPDHLPDRVVVFTNGTMYLDNLAAFLEYFLAIKVSIYAGSNSERSKDKENNLKDFKNGNSHVLLSSLSSGGTGLNLEMANVVITYENWWNPNAEEQGKDRIRRISQKRKVRFALFSIVGGVDDVITHIGDAKESMINNIFKGHGGIKRADESAVEHVIFDRQKLAKVFARPGTKVVIQPPSTKMGGNVNQKSSTSTTNESVLMEVDEEKNDKKYKPKTTFKLSTPRPLTEQQLTEIVSHNKKTKLGFYENPEANVQLFNSFWTSSFTKTVKPIVHTKNRERKLLNIYLASRQTIEQLGEDAGQVISTNDYDPVDDSDDEEEFEKKIQRTISDDSGNDNSDSDSDSKTKQTRVTNTDDDTSNTRDKKSKKLKKKKSKPKTVVVSSDSDEGTKNTEGNEEEDEEKGEEKKKTGKKNKNKRKRPKKSDKKEEKRKKKKAKISPQDTL